VDQVLIFHLAFLLDDGGPARRGELRPHRGELVLDDGLDARPRAQDVRDTSAISSAELV